MPHLGQILSYRSRSPKVAAKLSQGAFGRRFYTNIYVIDAPAVRLMKFGRASDPKHRFATIQGSSPVPVELLGYVCAPIEFERGIHNLLVEFNSHGEWFHAEEPVREIAGFIRNKRVRAIAEILPQNYTAADYGGDVYRFNVP